MVVASTNPSAWSCSRLGKAPFAAASITALTAAARDWISAIEFTSAAVSRSITLLSNADLAAKAVVLLLPLKLRPRALNWEAFRAVPAEVPPSARASNATAAFTTVCTSPPLSFAVDANDATALFTSAKLLLVTPVTLAAV